MDKPKVVVLCGSSKFVDIMAVCAWFIEKDENAIAIGLHLLPSWYRSGDGTLPPDHLAEHEGVAAEMDALHRRKIDLCNEIFVVNYQSYIGKSTAHEVSYAMDRDKTIRWFTHDKVGDKVMENIRLIQTNFTPITKGD
jgi:hypothetical protein